MKVSALVAAVVATTWFLPDTAFAADWYVDASAASGGDGSMAKPFATINASLAVVSRGDTVWIASGVYDETVNVYSIPGSSGTTTFRAMPMSTPVIDGASGSGSAGFVVQSAVPNTTFMDLTIQNGESGAIGIQFYHADGGQVVGCTTKSMSGSAVAFYYSNQGTVSGCTLQGDVSGRQTTGTVVIDNEVYGASAEGISLFDGSTNCTVSHNVIHDNYSVNLYLDSISHSTFDGNLIYETNPNNDLEGIEISDEYYSDLPAPVNSYNTITNNVIVGNAQGIVFWASGEWPTQELNDETGLRYDVIANNTVVDNGVSLKWDASPAHVGTIIQNNIFAANAASNPTLLLQANSAGGIAVDHNLWDEPSVSQPFLWLSNATDHAGFVSASSLGAGDVLADPMFAAAWTVPPATNLELAKGSPAIGAGLTLSQVPTDFLSAPRSGAYDLGAFQYGAIPPADAGGPPSSDSGVPPPSDASADVGAEPAGGTSSSGCGCRTAGASPSASHDGLLALIGALALVSKRRHAVRASR